MADLEQILTDQREGGGVINDYRMAYVETAEVYRPTSVIYQVTF